MPSANLDANHKLVPVFQYLPYDVKPLKNVEKKFVKSFLPIFLREETAKTYYPLSPHIDLTNFFLILLSKKMVQMISRMFYWFSIKKKNSIVDFTNFCYFFFRKIALHSSYWIFALRYKWFDDFILLFLSRENNPSALIMLISRKICYSSKYIHKEKIDSCYSRWCQDFLFSFFSKKIT